MQNCQSVGLAVLLCAYVLRTIYDFVVKSDNIIADVFIMRENKSEGMVRHVTDYSGCCGRGPFNEEND